MNLTSANTAPAATYIIPANDAKKQLPVAKGTGLLFRQLQGQKTSKKQCFRAVFSSKNALSFLFVQPPVSVNFALLLKKSLS